MTQFQILKLREKITNFDDLDMKDFGELLCCRLHVYDYTFKDLIKYWDVSKEDLAELVADHIKKL